MIDDLNLRAELHELHVDLCLIGAGAAGITIARELADTNLEVCLLEAGGLEYDEESQALYAGVNVGLPVGLDFGRLREFGGTTNHWSGRCGPLDPLDFQQRDWVPSSGWPIQRGDLDPYYRRAVTVCGFPQAWSPDAAVLAQLGVTMPEFSSGRIKPYIWHYARTGGDTPWNWGVQYRDTLQASPKIKVLLHANLTAFETTESSGAIEAVTVQSLNGNRCRVSAKHYVLCCGGIENARLLLAGCKTAPEGLGNRHDVVGRFFAQHPRGASATVIPTDPMSDLQDMFGTIIADSGLEFGLGLALSEQAQREHGLLNCSAVLDFRQDPHSGWAAGKDIWQSVKAGHVPPRLREEVWDVARDLGSIVTNLERHLVEGRRAKVPLLSASIVLDIEQSPNPASRISLSDELDMFGMRKVEADWRLSDIERHTAKKFTTFVAAEFARLGLGRARLEDWLSGAAPLDEQALQETYHYIGTTRMADDPRQGVVDRDCRVHGIDNLYVAGSSVFPTGGHINPTFSIVALALRLSDHLKDRLLQA